MPQDNNKEHKSDVGSKVAVGTIIVALIGLLTAFLNQGGLGVIEKIWEKSTKPITSQSSPPTLFPTSPSVSQPLSTTPMQFPTQTPTSTPIALQGKYSFSWVEEANTACWKTEALRELTISQDGSMQGTVGIYQFNGKVDPDGTWSAQLNTGGYRFNGTIHNGKLLGTYTAQPSAAIANQTQCQGKVTGFKNP